MELKEAIEIIGTHQKWRRGEVKYIRYSARRFTKALDLILSEIKKTSVSTLGESETN
jgi:hypothetical protein